MIVTSEPTPVTTRRRQEELVEQRRRQLERRGATGRYTARGEHQGKRTFLIHDNGGRPFKVVVNGRDDKIRIYELDLDESQRADKVVFRREPVKVVSEWEGYWPGCDTSYYKQHGNTVLIRLSPQKYMWVGNRGVVTFKTPRDHPIQEFVSPLGNSDVAYPVAWTDDEVLFLIENERVPRDALRLRAALVNSEDLMAEFYERSSSRATRDPWFRAQVKSVKNWTSVVERPW